jgi:hypothetical protein
MAYNVWRVCEKRPKKKIVIGCYLIFVSILMLWVFTPTSPLKTKKKNYVFVNHSEKFLSIFGGPHMSLNIIPTRKEEGYYAYSLIGSDLMPIRSSPINSIYRCKISLTLLRSRCINPPPPTPLWSTYVLGYDFLAANLTFSKNWESWLYVRIEYLNFDNHGGIS